ncbi:HAD family hydrolase [Marinomonas piezotolerans]|uniref:HAD family hydrolase n=1 Tax=Marinomonas piezotolerans TaxID=2213058 RepID=A0A370UDS0_9GAMM|nr:HAD family hydrolase [Marinomonas piezotolerans]RDL45932.1 HAD family hydrolase [Marinomonas piezotolerans]
MLKTPITTIAFDADDTLWRNEDFFQTTQQSFVNLLSAYHSKEYILEHLNSVQVRNLANFGYGIKGFTLSMIETAIELTDGRISGYEIHQIIKLAKEMLSSPVDVLPGIEALLKSLKGRCQLMVITKGDLLDQEGKIARSGLSRYFDFYEVVSKKDRATYENLFQRLQISLSDVLMIGNSVRSDILPILDAGGHALHVPYHTTWSHEEVQDHELTDYPQISRVDDATQIQQWLESNIQLSE